MHVCSLIHRLLPCNCKKEIMTLLRTLYRDFLRAFGRILIHVLNNAGSKFGSLCEHQLLICSLQPTTYIKPLKSSREASETSLERPVEFSCYCNALFDRLISYFTFFETWRSANKRQQKIRHSIFCNLWQVVCCVATDQV